MFFIPHTAVPKHKKVTYLRIVSAWRSEKENPRRVLFTVGGDRLDYAGDVSTKSADLATVKLLLNKVVSSPGATFLTIDIKDFYLNTPMDKYEYMHIPVWAIPDDIREQYRLADLIHNGHAVVEIHHGMYGLKQAGCIAYDQLVAYLAPHDFAPATLTPGLWIDKRSKLVFTLIVDDLVSVNRNCDISMPGYVQRALLHFKHPHPKRPQHSPFAWTKPVYGKGPQYTPPDDDSASVAVDSITHVQEIVGTFLCYARGIDNTMLMALGKLGSLQSKPTENTMKALTQFLNYAATHSNAVVRFTASGMILYVVSDGSHLSAPKSCSRTGGYFFLSSPPNDAPATASPPPLNGPVHIECKIMHEVLSSATETELGSLFHNCKEACPLRTALEENC
ncbi:hypothetical protein MPSEU_000058100 [Mayamaea pseudoterrestris]|nr:hypothetical protein MPSEU_000058100 [Mayamaea pseudoterrestris]